MQTATLDLLDVDPFDLIEDEEPFAAPKEKVDAAASVAELLERALKVIAEFEQSSRRPARKPRRARKARVTAHLPGEHNQQSHGNSVSSPNAFDGITVLDIDSYAEQYGHVLDDGGVQLGEDLALTIRYFENGDMHVALDLEDEKTQVLEEMNPESMRQLAYDLEEVLAVDEAEFEGGDPYDIVADANSTQHGFYVAKDGVGDVRIQPPDAEDDDYLEVSSEKAADFVNALLDMADAYEEHFADGGEVVAGRARPSRRKQVVAHGNHDQSTHGRKRGLSVPKAGPPKPAHKKAEPKAKPSQSEVDQAKLKLDRAVQMHGSDRSKWSKKDRDAAAKLDKLIADSQGPAPLAPDAAPKAAPKKAPPKAPATKKALPNRPDKPATAPSGSRPSRVSDQEFTSARGGEKSSKKLSTVSNGSHVELIEFGDGSKAIYKASKSDAETAKSEFDAEQLGVHVAEALGLKPPKMHRTDDDKAYFDYVGSGKVAGTIPSLAKSSHSMGTGEFHDSRDGRRIGLLDALVENPDRHQGNWIVQDDGSITPIDHGLSWESALDDADGNPADKATGLGGFTDHYIDQKGFTGEWRDNDLSPKYVAGLRQKLQALRPAFDDVGRSALHDRMMARLDIIASHAKGSVAL